jgi:predicted MPP superfamily phosphohydrolase
MKYLFPLIMMLLFIGIIVLANFYLSRRFAWSFSIDNIKWLHLLFAALPIYMIGGLIGLSNTTSSFVSLLYIGAALITGIMLYLVLSVLLVDLIHLFIKLNPLVFGISALTLTVLVSGYGISNATNTKVSQLEVPIEGLKKEIRVMHLSDIHIGHFRARDYMQKLVDLSKEESPDMLVITGDLFDGKIQLKKENLLPLKQLEVPIYFVEGNHDGYSGVEKIKDLLRELGVNVLENEVIQQGDIQIVGLNHMKADGETNSVPPNPSEQSIRTVLSELKIDRQKPTILLHHSPDGINYAHENGVDLYLCGHTHAGQLFPINYLNDLLFKYNKSLSVFKGTRIYVSQGAGTFGPPMRVGTKSEITMITLLP